jgi:hypothetical protein
MPPERSPSCGISETPPGPSLRKEGDRGSWKEFLLFFKKSGLGEFEGRRFGAGLKVAGDDIRCGIRQGGEDLEKIKIIH